MKTLKKLLGITITAVATMVMVSCGESTYIGLEDSELNQDLELTIDIEDITATTAKVKVSHNGASSDTWFGLLTTEVDENEEDLIAAAVDKFKADGTSEGLRKSKSYVGLLKDLQPQTAYKYIAFGLSSEGVVYGSSSSYEFVTEQAANPDDEPGSDGTVNGMAPNSAWSLRYVGAGTLYEQNFDHIVEVTSTDSNTYVVTAVYAEDYNPLYLRELGEELIVEMKEYLEYFNNTYNTSYVFSDMLYTGNASEAFDLDPGNYKAIAIGVTSVGTLSGLYAASDTFEVKASLPTAAYSDWLGNWTVEGNNGATSPINLTTKVANKSFYMTGWSGIDDWAVEVEYDADLNSLFFYSQLVAENVDFGSYGMGDVYFLGGDAEGYFYTNSNSDYGIAIAGILDDGTKAIVRYGAGVANYPTFNQMFYMACINDEYYDVAGAENLPDFPAAMKPRATTASTSKQHLCRFTTLRKPSGNYILRKR